MSRREHLQRARAESPHLTLRRIARATRGFVSAVAWPPTGPVPACRDGCCGLCVCRGRASRPATRAHAATSRVGGAGHLESLTGLRSSAPTVLGGVLLNVTDDPLPAAFTLSELPAGVGLTSVTPAFATGEASGWSCAGLQCQLLDPTGAPASIPPDDAVTALVALSTPAALDPASTVAVTTNQNAPVEVTLALPDGAAALGDSALLATFGAPPTVVVGTAVTGRFTVTNPGSAEATGVVVTMTAPIIDGVDVVAGGPDGPVKASRAA